MKPLAQQHVDHLLERPPVPLSEFLDPGGDVILYGQRRTHQRTIYKPLGIRIVSVAPGAYLTTAFGDNTDNYIEAGDPQLVEHSQKLRDHFAAIVSGGKPQDPQEVADRIYECVTANDVPVHNPVGADAERLSGLIDSLPSRQAFVAAMEQMLLPRAAPARLPQRQ